MPASVSKKRGGGGGGGLKDNCGLGQQAKVVLEAVSGLGLNVLYICVVVGQEVEGECYITVIVNSRCQKEGYSHVVMGLYTVPWEKSENMADAGRKFISIGRKEEFDNCGCKAPEAGHKWLEEKYSVHVCLCM